MPGAFASLDTGFPNLSGNGSTDDKLRAIQDYLYQLLEQLRYSMNNLGAENFNENSLKEITDKITEPIEAEIVDVERGLTTLIEITAEGVRLDVRKDYAAEWTSANNQKYYVGDVVKVTASDNSVKFYKCTQNHTAAAGNKPPSAYWTEIAAADVAYSRFDMNANAIRTEVTRATDAEGDLSTSITETAKDITLAAQRTYAPLWAAGTYYKGNIVRKETTVGDTVTVKYYKCTAESTSAEPPATGWTEIQSPDVLNSRFTVTADAIKSEVTRATDAEGELSSSILQLPGEIMLNVKGEYANEWTNGTVYYQNDVVKVSTISDGKVTAVAFYKAKSDHTAAAGNKPPNATYWDSIPSANVQSVIDMNLNGITLAYNNTGVTGDNSSYIKLHKDGIDMGGGTIQMTNVKADSLTANAVSAIQLSADQITTGTLKADDIDILDSFWVYASGPVIGGVQTKIYCGKMGGVYVNEIPYPKYLRLEGPDEHLHITLADEQLTLWCGNTEGTKEATISMTPTAIVANKSIIMPSDARIKKDIDHDLTCYEDFFMALRPCRFRMVDGSSGRYHTGYIAQEVEQALLDNGLSTEDLAALVKNPNAVGYSKEDPMYGLCYSELIALQTHMIQRLEQRITDLENRVRMLEESGYAS